jgi:putative transport protein
MNCLTELFTESSIAHDILVYSLVIALGLAVGRVRIFGISLGITWVLFFDIFFANIIPNQPGDRAFHQRIGLVLFVYFVGLQVVRFFNSSKITISLNLLALLAVVIGSDYHWVFTAYSTARRYGRLNAPAVTNTWVVPPRRKWKNQFSARAFSGKRKKSEPNFIPGRGIVLVLCSWCLKN